MKYLGIYLTKYIEDLYGENCKTPVKDTKEEIGRWRNIPSLCVGRLNIVRMSVPPNLIYRVNAISVKMLTSCFVDTNQLILP